MDFIRLTKLLALTTSPADGEALNAMRMANSLLTKNNMSWEQVIKVRLASVTVNEVKSKPKSSKKERIDHMLEVCMMTVRGSGREFIESIASSYERYGSLTDNQFRALQKFFDRVEG